MRFLVQQRAVWATRFDQAFDSNRTWSSLLFCDNYNEQKGNSITEEVGWDVCWGSTSVRVDFINLFIYSCITGSLLSKAQPREEVKGMEKVMQRSNWFSFPFSHWRWPAGRLLCKMSTDARAHTRTCKIVQNCDCCRFLDIEAHMYTQTTVILGRKERRTLYWLPLLQII